jgi:hypothetical protein
MGFGKLSIGSLVRRSGLAPQSSKLVLSLPQLGAVVATIPA